MVRAVMSLFCLLLFQLFPGVEKEPSDSGAEEVSAQKTLGKGPSERLNLIPSL